jgi:hypothetical protein
MDAMGRNLRDDPLDNHDFFIDDSRHSYGMATAWARFRHALLYTIGFGCVLLGIVLTITVVRLETLQSQSTTELSAIVGLFALPALTLLSTRLNRSTLKSLPATDYQQKETDLATDGRIAHQAHSRGVRPARHTRVSETVGSTTASQRDTEKRETSTAA